MRETNDGQTSRVWAAAIALLGAALWAGSAGAVVIIEDTDYANDIFGDTFETRTQIADLEMAIGTVFETLLGDKDFDFIGFIGLVPGSTLALSTVDLASDFGLIARLLDSDQNLLASFSPFVTGIGRRPVGTAIVTVPADGEVVFYAAPGDDFARFRVKRGIPEPPLPALLAVLPMLLAIAAARRHRARAGYSSAPGGS